MLRKHICNTLIINNKYPLRRLKSSRSRVLRRCAARQAAEPTPHAARIMMLCTPLHCHCA
jgi:hypothetical protein